MLPAPWQALVHGNLTNETQAEHLEEAVEKASLQLGFQVVMLCGLVGVICLFCAWQLSMRSAIDVRARERGPARV